VKFTLIIDKPYSSGGRKKPMLVLARERCGEYNAPKKKLNRENTRSRKTWVYI